MTETSQISSYSAFSYSHPSAAESIDKYLQSWRSYSKLTEKRYTFLITRGIEFIETLIKKLSENVQNREKFKKQLSKVRLEGKTLTNDLTNSPYVLINDLYYNRMKSRVIYFLRDVQFKLENGFEYADLETPLVNFTEDDKIQMSKNAEISKLTQSLLQIDTQSWKADDKNKECENYKTVLKELVPKVHDLEQQFEAKEVELQESRNTIAELMAQLTEAQGVAQGNFQTRIEEKYARDFKINKL